MAQNPIRKPYASTPRGWLGWRALAWCLATGLVLGLSLLVVAQTVPNLRIPATQTYVGNLSSSVEPAQIIVPSGVAISEFLVSVDETVRRGQTLLVFDQEQLQQERRNLDSTAKSLKAELLCLEGLQSGTSARAYQDPKHAPTNGGLAAPALENEIASPEETTPRCRAFAAKLQHAEHSFDLKRQSIVEEIEIISNFIDASTPGPLRLDIAQTQDVLERRLALALARHALVAQKNTLELDFTSQRQGLEESRMRMTADIGSDLAEIDVKRGHLSQLIKTPRIQAPVAGRVLRLRHVTPQQKLPHDTEVLSILPSQNDGYRIAFETEPKHLAFLKMGQNLQVEILGLPHKALTLEATIQRYVTNTNGGVTVVAQVSPASQTVLAKSPYSQQIRDASSTVAIRAYRQDESFANVVRSTALALLPERFWWRTTQDKSEIPPVRSAASAVDTSRRLLFDLF